MGFRRTILLTVLVLTTAFAGAPRVFVPSSGEGPTFSDYGDFYVDWVTSPVVSVFLGVTVKDADGVQTVIGSISNISELEWHNVTMSVSGTIEDRYYGGYNVSVPEDGHTYEFHVKYYASDTLGNWNTSNTTHYYISRSDMWRVPNTIVTGLGILGFTSAVVVLIVILRRRNH
jgi:hypothetical protein